MTLEKQIRLAAVEIAARLQLILMGISADRATEVPEKFRLLLEAFKFSGNERYVFPINIQRHNAT
jgi:hypothetical protein